MLRAMYSVWIVVAFFSVGVHTIVAQDKQEKQESQKNQENVVENISDQRYPLVSSRKAGTLDKVEVTLKAVGDITQFLEDQKSESDKMECIAQFKYEELAKIFTAKPSGRLQSLRYYDTAKATIKISDQINTPELEKSRKFIVCDVNNNTTLLFSPNGSLKNDQLLLIEDLPGNTLLLDQLLPGTDVKIGDTWMIPEKALRSLLGLDLVESSDMEAILTSVKDNIALVEIVGNATGAFLGAASEMKVRVKYQFDLTKRRITWLGLLIEEDRSLSHVGPAMKLIAQVLLVIEPDVAPKILLDSRVNQLSMEPSEQLLLLRYEAPERGPWMFSHDRRWYVILDEPNNTKIRMLNKGELISQCDIAVMPKVNTSSITTLETFQKDLKTGLGENFGEIVSASQRVNENKYRELRVIIDGTAEDLSLRWVYYLLTDSEGNQALLAFVIQADMLEIFGQSDLELVKSFKLAPKIMTPRNDAKK